MASLLAPYSALHLNKIKVRTGVGESESVDVGAEKLDKGPLEELL